MKSAKRKKSRETPWEEYVGTVTNVDNVTALRAFPDASVQIIFSDPPFNIGEDYDLHDDDLPLPVYLAQAALWIEECARVLKPTGSLWIASGWRYAAELKVIAEARFNLSMRRSKDRALASDPIGRIGGSLKFRQQVIWYFTFGANSPKRFTPSHTVLLHFVKSEKDSVFNSQEVRVPSARQTEYNDHRASPDGRLPDDTWILRPRDPEAGFSPDKDVQSHSRIAGTFKQRGETPNQMPEQLLGRIIRACSDPGDLVVDPFCGSGTTVAVAKKLGRKFATFDVSGAYVLQAKARVDGVSEGDMLDGPLEWAADDKPAKARRNLKV